MGITSSSVQTYLFKKIGDRAVAFNLIKWTSIAIYFFAGMETIYGLIQSEDSVIFDGACFVVLALLMHIFKSRIAAVLLFLNITFGIITTIYITYSLPELGIGHIPGRILIPLIFAFFIFRALQATFYLNKKV